MSAAFVVSGLLAARHAHSTPRGATDEPVALVIAKDAFRPETVLARRGETVRLRVSASDGEHCLAIDELRVEKRVLPGKPVVVEVTPDRTGTFDLYCCLDPGDARGRLVVSD